MCLCGVCVVSYCYILGKKVSVKVRDHMIRKWYEKESLSLLYVQKFAVERHCKLQVKAFNSLNFSDCTLAVLLSSHKFISNGRQLSL